MKANILKKIKIEAWNFESVKHADFYSCDSILVLKKKEK